MFSSTNTINNPLPQLPSSSFQVPLADAAAGFFPFHTHIFDPLLAHNYYLPPNYTTNIDDAPSKLKKAARKDRHSKISTSRGLRDRRVRLSIGISRDFFDLQDKLGFETASKTIEWLLGKSNKEIQQLKNKSSSSPSSSSNEGVAKKVKMSQKDHDPAREYRAKKRERARERTREKSCNIVPRKCVISDDHHYESNPNSGLTQLGPHDYIHNNITTNNHMTSFFRVEEAINVSQTKMMMRSQPGELKRV